MRAKVYAYTCIINLDKQGDIKSYLKSFRVIHISDIMQYLYIKTQMCSNYVF